MLKSHEVYSLCNPGLKFPREEKMNLLESASFFDEVLILEMPKSITALRARPTESNV